MSFKEDIYTKSPLAIQKILVNIEGYRLENRRYNNRYQEIYQQIHLTIHQIKFLEQDIIEP